MKITKFLKMTIIAAFTCLCGASIYLPNAGAFQSNVVEAEDGSCVRTKASDGTVTPYLNMFSLVKVEERTIYFDLDRSDVLPNQLLKIAKLAETLTFNKISKVKIIGYTDDSGSASHNKDLAGKRAGNVKDQLSKLVKLDSVVVETKSMGSTDFAKDCTDKKSEDLKKCRDLNRRVVVELQEVVVNNK